MHVKLFILVTQMFTRSLSMITLINKVMFCLSVYSGKTRYLQMIISFSVLMIPSINKASPVKRLSKGTLFFRKKAKCF